MKNPLNPDRESLEKKIAALAKLFPECVALSAGPDGAVSPRVDLDALRRSLGEAALEAPERYEFTWPGKRAAVRDAARESRKSLAPWPEESYFWDAARNFYIEGDNLDVLKLVTPRWRGKFDLIYIDPPYNTGSSAFVYRDDFSKYGAPSRDDPDLSHANWCSMLFSRLLLARPLLAETGALFMSIDDGEYANAVKILDEIFGREHFVATVVWETKKEPKGIPPAAMRVNNHEYILCYAKSSAFRFVGDPRDVSAGFANPDGDPRGPWKRQYLQRFGCGFRERTVVDPATGRAYTFETPYAQEKLDRWIAEKRIIFPTSPSRYPARKEFFSEYKNPYKPIVTSWGLFSTKVGSEELKRLFGGEKVFDYAKPLELLKTLVRRAAPPDAFALDFFAGSGALGHAVMAVNAEDGGSRRFALVQAPEPCGKRSAAYRLGFPNIGAICRERLRRAGELLMRESGAEPADVGFRAYRAR
ncbi:MAG: site-specific DNA-methyltransferase [Thermoguttaceae bacterium]|nr:site-specific DNA-methyltransferase [Thermoguttaceae bacterium]